MIATVGELVNKLLEIEFLQERIAKLDPGGSDGILRAVEHGTREAYHVSRAMELRAERRALESEVSNTPGVDKLRLRCDRDKVSFDSGWLKQQRAIVAEDRGLDSGAVNGLLVREFAGLIREVGKGKVLSAPPVAKFLGDGRYQVGDEFVSLAGSQSEVVQALVELRSATFDQLKAKSGAGNPSEVLKPLCEDHLLAPYLNRPGGRSKRGYSTTIIDGRKQLETSGSKS